MTYLCPECGAKQNSSNPCPCKEKTRPKNSWDAAREAHVKFKRIVDNEFTVKIDGHLVTKEAKNIIDKLLSLKKLGLSACWIFEGDDEPEYYATCESLLRYLEDFSGKLIRLGPHDIKIVRQTSLRRDIQNGLSGKFLIQLD